MNEPAVAAPPQTAAEITRASKSNLALAFVALPPERRKDIQLFYAFCRLVDDITDDPGIAAAERSAQLQAWRRALREEFEGEPPLARAVRAMISKYPLPLEP